jgi:hypothetical protein
VQNAWKWLALVPGSGQYKWSSTILLDARINKVWSWHPPQLAADPAVKLVVFVWFCLMKKMLGPMLEQHLTAVL